MLPLRRAVSAPPGQSATSAAAHLPTEMRPRAPMRQPAQADLALVPHSIRQQFTALVRHLHLWKWCVVADPVVAVDEPYLQRIWGSAVVLLARMGQAPRASAMERAPLEQAAVQAPLMVAAALRLAIRLNSDEDMWGSTKAFVEVCEAALLQNHDAVAGPLSGYLPFAAERSNLSDQRRELLFYKLLNADLMPYQMGPSSQERYPVATYEDGAYWARWLPTVSRSTKAFIKSRFNSDWVKSNPPHSGLTREALHRARFNAATQSEDIYSGRLRRTSPLLRLERLLLQAISHHTHVSEVEVQRAVQEVAHWMQEESGGGGSMIQANNRGIEIFAAYLVKCLGPMAIRPKCARKALAAAAPGGSVLPGAAGPAAAPRPAAMQQSSRVSWSFARPAMPQMHAPELLRHVPACPQTPHNSPFSDATSSPD